MGHVHRVDHTPAYIAPPPPPELQAVAEGELPAAVPEVDPRPGVPKFDQDYIMEFLKEDEWRDADNTTLLMERWSESGSLL